MIIMQLKANGFLSRNDVAGARLAGCSALLYGSDVRNFEDLADRVLQGLDSESLL